MTLSTFRPDKPSEKASAELYPIWQLAARDPEVAEPSIDRGQTSRKTKNASITNPSSIDTRPNLPSSPTRTESAVNPKAAGSKNALEGDSRCSKMHDRVACLCAVRNGGGISQDGQSWYSKRGGASALTNEAFVQCQLKARR
jgi:hypothetical protein